MRILLATDGSTYAECAADLLGRLPLTDEVRVTVVSVVENAAFEEAARELLVRTEERLRPLGWPVESLLRSGEPAEEIIAAAAGADLVVLGARGLGCCARLLLGSVSTKVATYSPASVLVARPADKSTEPLRSVIGFDGSESAWVAVRTLSALPLGDRMEVTLAGVMTVTRFYGMDLAERASDLYQEQKTLLLEQLDEAASVLRTSAKVVATELREGTDVASDLLTAAEERRAELVVLGDEPSGDGLMGRFVGSTGSKILHHAHTSVWIARHSRS